LSGKEALFGSNCATIVQPEFQRFIMPLFGDCERRTPDPSVNSHGTNFIRTWRAALVLIEGNQQFATNPDESLSPSLFTFRSHFAAIHRD
jgi:hypothetical protein